MRLKERINLLKDLERWKKFVLTLVAVLIVSIIAIIVGYISNMLSGGLFESISGSDSDSSFTVAHAFIRGLFKFPNIFWTLLLSAIVFFVILFYLFKQDWINPVKTISSDTGVVFLENGTLGSRRMALPDEIKEDFECSTNPGELVNTTYGEIREEPGTYVSLKREGLENLNHLVSGMSGAGKSVSLVRPVFLQALKRHESILTTDPSNELYDSLAGYAESLGYHVCVLNLKDLTHSNGWNCLREVVNPETERLNETRLADFATTFIKNATGSSEEHAEDFWEIGAINLIQAYIAVEAWNRESKILEYLKSGIESVLKGAHREKEIGQWLDPIADNMASIVTAKEIFRKACRECGIPEEYADKCIKDYEDAAPAFNIAQLYYDMVSNDSKLDEIVHKSEAPADHPAVTCSNIFYGKGSPVSETVRASTRQGVTVRMSIFGDRNLRRVLSTDEIDLYNFNRTETACFVIKKDTNVSLAPITALFFKFFFEDASTAFDKETSLARYEGREDNGLNGVTVILDELASQGIIPGFPSYFDTMRKRNLYIYAIVQSVTQLIDKYGETGLNSISNNCATWVFLGGTDKNTVEMFAEYIGTGTVRTESHVEGRGALNRRIIETNVTEASRNVKMIDELMSYKDGVIVIRHGSLACDLKRFPYYKLPVYPLLIPKTIEHLRSDPKNMPKDPYFEPDELVLLLIKVEKALDEDSKAYLCSMEDDVYLNLDKAIDDNASVRFGMDGNRTLTVDKTFLSIDSPDKSLRIRECDLTGVRGIKDRDCSVYDVPGIYFAHIKTKDEVTFKAQIGNNLQKMAEEAFEADIVDLDASEDIIDFDVIDEENASENGDTANLAETEGPGPDKEDKEDTKTSPATVPKAPETQQENKYPVPEPETVPEEKIPDKEPEQGPGPETSPEVENEDKDKDRPDAAADKRPETPLFERVETPEKAPDKENDKNTAHQPKSPSRRSGRGRTPTFRSRDNLIKHTDKTAADDPAAANSTVYQDADSDIFDD